MIIQPPSTLLAGASGSGKTSSIATQLKYGLKVFVVVTEPDGVSSLIDACERLKLPIDNLHWAQCFPAAAGWMELEQMVNNISLMDQKQLADQRDMGKRAFHAPAIKFLRAFSNFKCDRTGKEFGDFTKWDDTCSLNVDSLTGWCTIGFGCTVGFKPTANPGEWGIAQNFVYNMLVKINSDRRCFFTLTSHVEKEMDDMTGVRRVMVSATGSKLAPKIPKFFGDFIKCERRMIVSQSGAKAEFVWSTLDQQMELKNRALPISDRLPADFGPIVDAYRRRLRAAQLDAGSLGLTTPQFKTPESDGAKQPPAPQPEATVVRLPAAPITPQTGGVKE